MIELMEKTMNVVIIEDNTDVGHYLSRYFFPDANVTWYNSNFGDLLHPDVFDGIDKILVDYQLGLDEETGERIYADEIIRMLATKLPHIQLVLLTGSISRGDLPADIREYLGDENILLKPQGPVELRKKLGFSPHVRNG